MAQCTCVYFSEARKNFAMAGADSAMGLAASNPAVVEGNQRQEKDSTVAVRGIRIATTISMVIGATADLAVKIFAMVGTCCRVASGGMGCNRPCLLTLCFPRVTLKLSALSLIKPALNNKESLRL